MMQDVLTIGGADVPVWPEGQSLDAMDKNGSVFKTRFADRDAYHPELVDEILRRAELPENAKQRSRSLGGTKLYGLHEWNCPAADLIEARAMALFKQALGLDQAFIDISWANVYRRGDYIMPHSHVRALASVVYGVSAGEKDPEDPDSGAFAIVDPRYGPCCQVEPGRLSNPLRFNMYPGTMLIMPGQMVHCVNPYFGDKPRITIAWNINRAPQSGSTLDKAKLQSGDG